MMIFQNYKKIITSVLALMMFLTSSVFVFSETATIDKALSNYYKVKNETDKIVLLRYYASLIIDERIVDIDSLGNQVNPDSRISDGDKLLLNSFLGGTKSLLQENKDNLEQVDDLDSLELILEDVYTNTRVYQVVMPKAFILRSVSRSDYILKNNISVYLEDLDKAIIDLESKNIDTEQMRESLEHIEEVSDDIGFRIKIVKEGLDLMVASENLSEERSIIENSKVEILAIRDLLVDVQFEMGQLVKRLEPYY